MKYLLWFFCMLFRYWAINRINMSEKENENSLYTVFEKAKLMYWHNKHPWYRKLLSKLN